MADNFPAGDDPEEFHGAPMHLAGDPYFPGDLTEEEDPSENEEDPEEVVESDDEGILQDVQDEIDDDGPMIEEDTSDEEPSPPTPPRPYYQPFRRHGKGPLLMRTPRKSVLPMSHSDPFQPSFGLKRKPSPPLEPSWFTNSRGKRRIIDSPRHYEIGEPSQTQPPAPFEGKPEDDPIPHLMTQIDRLTDRVQPLEDITRAASSTSRALTRRVERLEEEEKDDTAAIQTLYHRMGASRTEARSMGAHISALQYQAQLAESRLDAAEHRATIAEQRQRQIQEQFDELVRYLAARFGW